MSMHLDFKHFNEQLYVWCRETRQWELTYTDKQGRMSCTCCGADISERFKKDAA